MKYCRYFFILIAAFLFAMPSVAAEPSVEALLALLEPLHSLKARFVQTILDGQGKVVQTSIGKLSVLRPGHFRWEVDRPVKQLIIADNKQLWIYDPDLEQVVIRPVAKEIGRTPAFLLSNVNSALSHDFTVRTLPSKGAWLWFALTPKETDSLFKVIQLGFLNKQIKELRMQDQLGHDTVIQLQGLQMNVSFPDSVFKFHAPKQVDVIDETKQRA